MRRSRFIVTGALLAFVAVAVGVFIGQEVGLWPRPGKGALRVGPDAPEGGPVPAVAPAPDRAVVYYFHSSQRCHACLQIEQMAGELLEREFAGERAGGRLEWKALVVEENADQARRYDALSSAVVVARVRAGREEGFVLLEDLWKFLDDQVGFNARLGPVVRGALPRADATSRAADASPRGGPP